MLVGRRIRNVYGLRLGNSCKYMSSLMNLNDNESPTFNWSRDAVQLRSESDILSHYSLGEVIGHGTYGICRKAVSLEDGAELCIKQIQKKYQIDYKREVILASRVSHSSICSPRRVFETDRDVFVVSEYYKGGELFDYLVEHNMFLGTLTEYNALCLVREMLVALEVCHKAEFAHLDIKPENFVFKLPPDEIEDDFRNKLPGNLVLIDFGAAQPFRLKGYASRSAQYDKDMDDYMSGEASTMLGGTASYVSPEVLHGRFSSRSDLWSLGVTLFIMIAGRRPFDTNFDSKPSVFERDVQRKIKEETALPLGQSLYSTCEELGLANSSTVSLLLNMMHPEPNLRNSSTELIEIIDDILTQEFV